MTDIIHQGQYRGTNGNRVFIPSGPSFSSSVVLVFVWVFLRCIYVVSSLPFIQKDLTQTGWIYRPADLWWKERESGCCLQPFRVGVSVCHQTRHLLLWRNLEMLTASNGFSFPVQLFFASRMALSHFYFLSVK